MTSEPTRPTSSGWAGVLTVAILCLASGGCDQDRRVAAEPAPASAPASNSTAGVCDSSTGDARSECENGAQAVGGAVAATLSRGSSTAPSTGPSQ